VLISKSDGAGDSETDDAREDLAIIRDDWNIHKKILVDL
jgi:hypothetical protein